MLKTLKLSSDAVDGLYGADRWAVIEAVLNNSLSKGHIQAAKFSRKSSLPKMFKGRSPMCPMCPSSDALRCEGCVTRHDSICSIPHMISRAYFRMVSTPIPYKKLRPDRKNHQNCPETSKLNENRLTYFQEIVKIE